jgi:hypothetical protein
MASTAAVRRSLFAAAGTAPALVRAFSSEVASLICTMSLVAPQPGSTQVIQRTKSRPEVGVLVWPRLCLGRSFDIMPGT